MAQRFRYDEPGTLSRPGPIGRTVRLISGVVCIATVLVILTQLRAFLTGSAFYEGTVWLAVLFGLYVFPDVVNIGFGRAWKRRYFVGALAALAGVSMLLDVAASGAVIGPALGTLLSLWLLYTFGHLGVAFLLAGLLATPGCEMRSIPQLWALALGKEASEHYCPGLLTPIDRWEARFRGRASVK